MPPRRAGGSSHEVRGSRVGTQPAIVLILDRRLGDGACRVGAGRRGRTQSDVHVQDAAGVILWQVKPTRRPTSNRPGSPSRRSSARRQARAQGGRREPEDVQAGHSRSMRARRRPGRVLLLRASIRRPDAELQPDGIALRDMLGDLFPRAEADAIFEKLKGSLLGRCEPLKRFSKARRRRRRRDQTGRSRRRADVPFVSAETRCDDASGRASCHALRLLRPAGGVVLTLRRRSPAGRRRTS